MNHFFTWPDRAAILENSWIATFKKWIKSNGKEANIYEMDQPFTHYQPDENHWRPILVLNGTSVTTGRRIITTNIAPYRSAEKEAKTAHQKTTSVPIFMDAYDLYEILSGQNLCSEGVCKEPEPAIKDIRFATAATNSARFPIISPPGTLRRFNPDSQGEIVDRIIDGGYFENDGITTTIDLVRALSRAGLRPAVVHIANDPLPYTRGTPPKVQAARAAIRDWRANSPPLPVAEDKSWLLFLRGPIGGLLATRGARSSYA